MSSVLVTAFEPYDQWDENSSWLALIELTNWFDSGGRVTTRRYPVDLDQVQKRLVDDMRAEYDVILHLGQSPGGTNIQLESIALNTRADGGTLIDDPTTAYQSTLPLARWESKLRDSGIPARVSYHAGTYLCNATMFLSQHLTKQLDLRTQTTFIHIPLTPAQAARSDKPLASLSTPMVAAGLAIILEDVLTKG